LIWGNPKERNRWQIPPISKTCVLFAPPCISLLFIFQYHENYRLFNVETLCTNWDLMSSQRCCWIFIFCRIRVLCQNARILIHWSPSVFVTMQISSLCTCTDRATSSYFPFCC
jgi:hypothetical protein